MILAATTYRPFIDPIDVVFNIQPIWFLLILPLCFFIAMAWKAVRIPELSRYWRQVIVMTVQALIMLFGLWVLTLLVVLYIIPFWTSKGL